MRKSIRTAVAVTAAISVTSAPAALARPAADPAVPAGVIHLTAGQLRAIDGHQPPDPLPAYPPVSAEPLTATGDDGGGGLPWVLIAVPLGIAAAAGATRAGAHRIVVRPRRTATGA